MEEITTALLKDLVKRKIGYGIVQPGDSSALSIPVVKVNNLISGLSDTASLDKTTETISNKYTRTILQGGELLVSVVGTIGKTAIVPSSFAGCNIARAVAMIDIPDEILTLWVKYYIDSPQGQSYIMENLNTTVQPTLNIKDLENLPIPLCNQKHIERRVMVLKTMDDKIALNNRINHNLEEQAQALYKSWFVDFEPFKDGKFVYSELGLIPEGWRIGKISDIATVTSGKRPNVKYESSSAEHSIPVFGASSVMAFTDSVYLKERAIITGRVGTLGILQRVDFPCWPSDNTLIIQSPYENFVYQELGEVDYSSLNRGSTQPLLTQSDLKSWSIIIPPKEIIAEYESLIRDNTDLIAEHCVQNQRLSLLRDTLLPQLMSGQLTC